MYFVVTSSQTELTSGTGTDSWGECRDLYQYDDPETREVLEGTEGDPDLIRQNMKRQMRAEEERGELSSGPATLANMISPRQGSKEPMRVRFRGFDPGMAWVRFPSLARSNSLTPHVLL